MSHLAEGEGEGFDFRGHLESNGFKEYNKLEEAINTNMIGLHDMLDCNEIELDNILIEYNVQLIQRKRFIKAMKLIPNAKVSKIDSNSNNSGYQNNIHGSQIPLHTNNNNSISSISTTNNDIEKLKDELMDSNNPADKKRLIGERLFPQIQIIEPKLAGKLTGMLLELNNSELVKLLIDQSARMGKINEALAILMDHQLPNTSNQTSNKPVQKNDVNGNDEKSNEPSITSGGSLESIEEESNNNDKINDINDIDHFDNFLIEIGRESFKIGSSKSTGYNTNDASLYVGNLSFDVTEVMLFELMNPIGIVQSIRILRDHTTRKSLGCAYVNFHNKKDAERVIDVCDGTEIKSKQIRLMWVKRNKRPTINFDSIVFMSGLSKNLDNKSLKDTFSVFGDIISYNIVSKAGCGYIRFENERIAQTAIKGTNGMTIDNKVIKSRRLTPTERHRLESLMNDRRKY